MDSGSVVSEQRHVFRTQWQWPDRLFLGTREDGEDCFDFRLRDISSQGIGVFIADGEHKPFEVGDQVRVFLPFHVNEHYFDYGPIAWTKQCDGELQCGVHLNRRASLYFPVYLEYEGGVVAGESENFPALFRRLAKDSYYLKRGKLIHFEHLAPYFEKLGGEVGKDGLSGADFFAQSLERVKMAVAALCELQELVTTPDFDPFSSSSGWDADKFRDAIRSKFNPNVFIPVFDTRDAYVYLESIRRLDHRLYINHNTLVLLDAVRSS